MTKIQISRMVLITAVAAVAPTLAAQRYWDTSDTAGLQAGNGTWDNNSTVNWNDSTGAGARTVWTNSNNDDAYFVTGGTNVVAVSGTVQLGILGVAVPGSQNTNTTLNGGTLDFTVASGGVLGLNSSDAGSLTINSNVTLSANQAWKPAGNTVVTVNGNISGASATMTTSANTNTSTPYIYMNGTNSFSAFSLSSGSSSTRNYIFLGGDTSIANTLTVSATSLGASRLFAGADNSFGSITMSNGYASLGGTNTINGTGTVTLTSGSHLVIDKSAAIGGSGNALIFNSGQLRILGTSMTSFGSRTLTTNTNANVRLDIDDASNTFTLDQVVAGGASAQLQKLGKGTLTLTSASTYGTRTTVQGGTLNVDNNLNGSLNSTAALTMAGGTFLLTGKNGAVTTQSINGVTVDRDGGKIRVDGGTSTSTTLNLGSITATTAGGFLHLQTTGTTTPVITSTTDKDATGIYGGRVVYNGNDWATTTSAGPTFTLSAYNNYNNGGAFVTSGTNTFNSSVSGNASLGGSLTTNTLKLASTAGTDSLAVGAGNTLTLTDGGLLFTGTQNYAITGGTLRSFTPTNSDLVIHQNGTGTLTISSLIANGNGNSTLTKSGPGTLILSGANTYSGTTYINGGVLSVGVLSGSNNNLGSSSSGSYWLNDGTLRYTGTTATRGGVVTLGSMGGAIDVVSSGTTLTLSSEITQEATGGAGVSPIVASLTKKGDGTLSITGTSTYTGGLYIEAGTVQVGGSGGNFNEADPNRIIFTSGSTGTLRLNSFSRTVGGLTTDPTTPGTTFVENGHASTAATLTVNSTFATRYAGTIRDGSTATLSLNKIGGNTLTLSGSNSYTGTTTVGAGTLLINGSIASSSLTTVGLAGRLGGGGAVGSTSVSGVIAPGNSIGQLTATNVTLNTGGVLESEIGTGTSADLLTVSGAMDLSAIGDVLELLGSETNFNGMARTLVTYGTLSGTFSTLKLNGNVIGTPSSFFVNSYNYALTYGDGSDDSIRLVIVPEPASMTLLALGALGMLRRRRG